MAIGSGRYGTKVVGSGRKLLMQDQAQQRSLDLGIATIDDSVARETPTDATEDRFYALIERKIQKATAVGRKLTGPVFVQINFILAVPADH